MTGKYAQPITALVLALGIVVTGACGTSAAQKQQIATEHLAALQQSIDVRGRAARNFDTSQFDLYFVDDPSVPLTDTQKAALERMAPGTPPAGFLTYVRAYYTAWRAADVAFAQVEAAVRASQKPDPALVATAVQRRDDALRVPALALVATQMITPDRYLIQADGDGIRYTVTIVMRIGRWLVAGEQRSMNGS